jgi:type IV pilus assembly protein PilN
MTRINLLPWRQRQRQRQQRGFLINLASAVVATLLALAGAHFYITERIDVQEARNQYLRTEIARLDRIEQEIRAMQRTEQQLIDRMEAIRRLQRSRPEMVHAFDDLVHLVPEDIYLVSLTARGQGFNLKGNARINNVVSDFMRELNQSPLFGEPQLRVIQNQRLSPEIPVSAFDLDVNRVTNDPAEQE